MPVLHTMTSILPCPCCTQVSYLACVADNDKYPTLPMLHTTSVPPCPCCRQQVSYLACVAQECPTLPMLQTMTSVLPCPCCTWVSYLACVANKNNKCSTMPMLHTVTSVLPCPCCTQWQVSYHARVAHNDKCPTFPALPVFHTTTSALPCPCCTQWRALLFMHCPCFTQWRGLPFPCCQSTTNTTLTTQHGGIDTLHCYWNVFQFMYMLGTQTHKLCMPEQAQAVLVLLTAIYIFFRTTCKTETKLGLQFKKLLMWHWGPCWCTPIVPISI